MKKILIGISFTLAMSCWVIADAIPKELITYGIQPAGKSEYADWGLTYVEGHPANLVIFKTQALGFRDTEKIYSDPASLLPMRVERDVRYFFKKEDIVERYDQKNFKVTITKFKGQRKISEQTISSDGPIYNAVLLPFYLRKVSELQIGWSFEFRVPQKFKATLISIEEIHLNHQRVKAYHFTSEPHKFEIWISDDQLRIPLKIESFGGFNYTLLLKFHETRHSQE